MKPRNFLLIYGIIFLLCSSNLFLGKQLQKVKKAESYENIDKSPRKLEEDNKIILYYGENYIIDGVYQRLSGSEIPFKNNKKENLNSFLGPYCNDKGKDGIFLDITHLNVEKLNAMNSFTDNCLKLRAINMSGLNFTQVVESTNAFPGLNLTYLDIKGTIFSDNLKETIQSSFDNKENLIVCQNEEIVKNVINKCCDYDIKSNKCKIIDSPYTNSNYIIVYYKRQSAYGEGFQNEKRNNLGFIVYDQTVIFKEKKLTVEKNKYLEVHFLSPIESLESFFSIKYDINAQNIVSIDFSNFDSSSLNQVESIFYNCISLKSVNLTDFKLSKIGSMKEMFYECQSLESIDLSGLSIPLTIENMNSMFFGCSSLKSLKLSFISTSSVTDMTSIFNGCSSLKVLDISNFNFNAVQSSDNAFVGLEALKYINLYNIQNYNSIKSSLFDNLNNKDRLIVTQGDTILTNEDYLYCSLNGEQIKCEESKSIIVTYGIYAEYKSGFGNDYRNEIYSIIYMNTMYFPEDELNIEANNEIIVYIFPKILYLNSFFDKRVDPNVENIISIDFSHYDTSSIADMNSMFYGCSQLTNLDLSKFITSSVTDMNSMFYGCSQLTSLDLSKFITSSVTDMNSMFYGCSQLTSLDLSRFITSSVTDMNSMFYGCSQLTSLDLSRFNTTSVGSMDSMFYGCSLLTYLDLSNFITTSVSNMDSMFSGCYNLEVLDLYNFDFMRVHSAKEIFKDLGNLKYINLYHVRNSYKNITESYINNLNGLTVCQKETLITNDNAQKECCYFNTSLHQCENKNYMVIYYGKDTEYKSFLNDYRSGIDFIKTWVPNSKIKPDNELTIFKGNKIEIYFSSNVVSLKNFFNNYYDPNAKNIISVDLSQLNSKSIKDMNSAFLYCYSLENIDFQDFDTSKVTDMNSMFSGCGSLKQIDVLSFDTSKVIDMGYMFFGCLSLEQIDLSDFDTSKVIDMESMFSGCDKLKFLDLSDFDTSLVYNMNSMFMGCSNLRSLDISNFDFTNVNISYNMFFEVNNLIYINLLHVKNSYQNFTESQLNSIDTLSVCQNEELITNEKATQKCCIINIITGKCEYSNYILVYYGKDIEYPNGFQNDYRTGIDFMIIGHNKTISANETFIRKAKKKLEIFYSSPISTLEYYFYKNIDPNVEYITKVDLDYLNLKVTKLSYLFSGCSSLETVHLTRLDTSLAVKINDMFFGCSSLKTVDLKHFNTEKVVDMTNLFSGCTSLESIDLSSFDTSNAEKMDNMFSDCRKLKTLDLSYFNTTSATSMKSMFLRCSSLQVLDISHFNFINAEYSNLMFKDVISLTYLNLYYVQNSYQNITGSKLNNINKLTVCQQEKLITKEDRIEACCYFDTSNNVCESQNYILIFYEEDVIYDKGFGEGSDNIDSYYIISHKDYYKKLTGKDELKINAGGKIEIYFTSDVISLKSFFNSNHGSNAQYIKSIDLSHLNTQSLNDISEMFYGCSSLKQINLSNFDFSLVKDMSSMFSGCSSLESIVFPKSSTPSLTKMNSMFLGCTNLKSIDLSYFQTSLVTDMNSVFSGCNSLELIDLHYFNTKSVTNMESMFSGCISLKYLDISNFDMEKIESAKSMFDDVMSLKYLNVYNVQKSHDNLTNSGLNSIDSLTVCQKENIITNENAIRKCCYFSLISEQCESTNYILVYYGENVEYNDGFIKDNKDNNFRNNIEYIINEEHNLNLKGTDKLIIRKGTKIEIYFSSPLTSLENFFSSMKDVNTEKIISIDLSNFDSSLVTNLNSLFYGCSSLKYVDLSYFDASSVVEMEKMFYGCSSIELIDLSYFDTSLVTNMNNLFEGCESLKYLDISSFNFEKTSSADSMFEKDNQIKYINLFNVENSKDYITESKLKEIKELTVCQKQNIITNADVINKCCYFNIESNECVNSNYITVYFGDNVDYNSAFIKDIEKRKEIDFIIYRDYYNQLLGIDKFPVRKGTKIEIYFSSPLTSLDNFFSSKYDENVAKIISFDFSNFDSSLVTNLNSLFNGCSSLEYVDLSYFDTSAVTDLSFMFYGCSSIESIDLSYFLTSSVTNMNNIFEGCESLKFLDISRFNMINVKEANSMFNNVLNLKYINLFNVENSKDYITESKLKEIKELTVCQKQNIITNADVMNKCCYFNIESNKCENTNYIILFYGKNVEREYIFIKDEKEEKYKMGVDYIINGNNHNLKLKKNDKLLLHKGSKIEIYFSEPITSLENYFSSLYDSNMATVLSIDLSHFDASLVTKMNSIFNGCTSLKSINLYNLDTKSVIDMNSMFYNCKSLESVNSIYLDTLSVTDMNNMFYYCSSLEYLDLSNFDTTAVTNMNKMFEGCDSLKFLDISRFNMINVNSYENMFVNVTNLLYINLYNVINYDTKITKSYINYIDGLTVCQKEDIITNINTIKDCCYFNINTKECENTNYIIIYYGKDADYKKGFENEFRNGEDIDFIVYNGNHDSKLTSTGDFSIGKGSKIEIYFKSSLKSLENYLSADYDLNMKKIISVDLSHFDTSSLINLKSAFLGCKSVESIDFSNFDTSLVTNMFSMFFGCSSLKSVDLSHFDLSSALYMNYMFSGCSSLESVDLSESKANSLVDISEMFYDCRSIKSIYLSKFDTSSVINMNYIFSRCNSLEFLDIPFFSMEKNPKVDSMFKNVKNLKYINLYYAKDYNDLIRNSELQNINSLTVCQKENILIKEDIINKCCFSGFESEFCKNKNYIILYYGKDVEYTNGFKNDYRNNIDYIINGNNPERLKDTDQLIIKENTKVEIYFSSPLASLKSFFDKERDNNAENLISIDLSHFDSSLIEDMNALFFKCISLKSIDLSYFDSSKVTDMGYMFSGCSSLQSIDLTYFDTSSTTKMDNMFGGCSSLESIDLSNFNTLLVSDMSSMFLGCSSLKSINLSYFKTPALSNINNMFSDCSSLKVLDISSFDLGNVKSVLNVFYKSPNLKYVNIYNISDEHGRIAETELKDINNLIVCQKENILNKEDVINKCCDYDIETDICTYKNSIIVYFDKAVEYPNGFEIDSFNETIDIRKEIIDFITIGDEDIKKYGSDPLTIEKDSKIYIHLKENFKNLANLFDENFDENVQSIVSIDLSHLNSSSVSSLYSMFFGCTSLKSIDFSNFDFSGITDMSFMFSGCSSLESVDLSDFNTSLVSDMNSMFSGCTSLKTVDLSYFDTTSLTNMNSLFYECSVLESIDLSYFNTSSVTNMNNIFSGCKSLKVLDISSFDMNKISGAKNMFNEVSDLKYIDIYDVKDSNNLLSTSELKNINNLVVCQKEKILTKEDITNNCCYYNILNNECKFSNYIIVYYGKDVEYNNGFKNDYRNDISFIINHDYNNLLDSTDKFSIRSSGKIKIYFNSQITSLESFFDSVYDINAESIVSIDFSHFDSSLITNMKKTFSCCTSLKSIEFSDFNTELVTIMSNIFFGCYELISINLSLFDTSKVTDISYMFFGCSSLESIELSNINTELVTKMNYMFYRCNLLNTINLTYLKASSLINLEKMFYRCQNLNSINLSNLYTSSVIDIDEMFYECNSLNYLDLSNFNMINCDYYNNMLTNISNIKYINLHNFKNDKIISKIFEKGDNLFVCQKEKIIKNPRVYNCCYYIFETHECNENYSTPTYDISKSSDIPTTTLESSKIDTKNVDTTNIVTKITTEHIHETEHTIPKTEKSTSLITEKTEQISNIPSTIAYDEKPTIPITEKIEKTTQIPNTITPSKQVQTNILTEKLYTTSTVENDLKSTTVERTEQFSTYTLTSTSVIKTHESIPTSDNIEKPTTSSTTEKEEHLTTISIPFSISLTSITTTYPKNIIQTTELSNKVEDTSIILLGFSGFRMSTISFTFYIHFVCIKGFIFSPVLVFDIQISYIRVLRLLQKYEANCNKTNENSANTIFLCEVQAQISNNTQIKIIPDFKFTSQDVKIAGISPYAYAYMDNLQNVDGQLNDFSNTTIFVLDHSQIYSRGNRFFNISGVIDEDKKKLGKRDLVLMVNINSEQGEEKEEFNCSIIDIEVNNYTLKCFGNTDINYDLQNAVSFIEDDILIVNFDENVESHITLNSTDINKYIRQFFSKNNRNISAGAIVAIILGSLVILGVILTYFICSRKKDTKNETIYDSSVSELKY